MVRPQARDGGRCCLGAYEPATHTPPRLGRTLIEHSTPYNIKQTYRVLANLGVHTHGVADDSSTVHGRASNRPAVVLHDRGGATGRRNISNPRITFHLIIAKDATEAVVSLVNLSLYHRNRSGSHYSLQSQSSESSRVIRGSHRRAPTTLWHMYALDKEAGVQ